MNEREEEEMNAGKMKEKRKATVKERIDWRSTQKHLLNI